MRRSSYKFGQRQGYFCFDWLEKYVTVKFHSVQISGKVWLFYVRCMFAWNSGYDAAALSLSDGGDDAL